MNTYCSLRIFSLLALATIEILGVTFTPEFKQRLATLQPIEIQPMKEVAKESSASSQSFLPVLEKDGGPITLTMEQLEQLGSKYLTDVLDEMDEPEVIQIAVDRETFELLLAAAQAYPETSAKIPTLENLEKFLLAAKFLNIDSAFLAPTLQKFSHEEICNLYTHNMDDTYIINALKNSLKNVLTWHIGTLQGHTASVSSLAISPDGKNIVSVSIDGTIKTWDIATGSLVKTLSFERGFGPSKPALIAISSDGKIMINLSFYIRNNIKIWNTDSGRLIKTISLDVDPEHRSIEALAISPNKKTIVSSSNNTIKIWDLATAKLFKLFNALPKVPPEYEDIIKVLSLAISAEGKYVVCGTIAGSIEIFNSTTGSLVRALPLDKDYDYYDSHRPIYSIAISSDNQRIVSGAGNKTLKVWDFATGSLLHTLPIKIESHHGHEGPVTALAISPDNKTIVSGSDDGKIKIWQQQSLEEFCAKRNFVREILPTQSEQDIPQEISWYQQLFNYVKSKVSRKGVPQ